MRFINELWNGQKTSDMIVIPDDWQPTEEQNCANFSSAFYIPTGFNFPEGIKYIWLDTIESIPEGFVLPKSCVWLNINSVESLPEHFVIPPTVTEYYLNGKYYAQ